MLNAETKRLESELRKSQRALKSREAEAAALDSTVADLRLECDFLKREVQSTQKEKAIVSVEQDTLKLDANRLRAQLREQTEAVTAAENEKLQSQHTIEEEILKAEHRLELAKVAAVGTHPRRGRKRMAAGRQTRKRRNTEG
uniref:Putative flagella associated protein n=1 Tax=Toxoplasma gondii TgCATBr9 TaxID=943120 RepID=A0A2T6ITR3_TOXGO|nr:putative flagella associated protein [Toxoplasma gondii TgCATBr9]